MTDTTVLADGMVGILHYTAIADDGSLIESTRGHGPVAWLFGSGSFPAGLEAALAGRTAGETFTVAVPPEDGFGLPSGREPQRVRRRDLPKGESWGPGSRGVLQGEDGQPFEAWVVKVEGAWVWLTTDHPLAGRTLTFEVGLEDVRPATADEQEHGHAHGAGGHGHH